MDYAQRHRFDEAAYFKIDGVYCKLIPLTQGQYATVWESDYGWLMRWNWCARWNKNPKTFYAVRGGRVGSGEPKLVYMHRFIAGLSMGDVTQCDHVDTKNALDCRRSNLRTATNAENHWNQGIRKNNKSGYKGVHYREDTGKWVAQITVNMRCIHLGSFEDIEDAHFAYCDAASRYHGDFCRTE